MEHKVNIGDIQISNKNKLKIFYGWVILER